MKTTLPERSLGIKPLLDQAIPEILIFYVERAAKLFLCLKIYQ